MKTVLILNHKKQACGVYQSGKRIYELLEDSTKINFIYREVESYQEFVSRMKIISPDAVLYNWHQGTMNWLTKKMVENTGAKSYFYFHTTVLDPKIGAYLFFGDYALDRNILPLNRQILVPRPILKYRGTYPKNNILTIGSFGLAFFQKGFHTLTKLVNATFERAVLNLHMPQSYFSDPTGTETKRVADECRRLNTNRGIQLNITQNFKNDAELLTFLAGNDINVFMHTENGEGLSGIGDYALAVKRPIAITNCTMFRHFMKDEIRLDKHPIPEILSFGTKPLDEFYEKWSENNFKAEMEGVFNEE